MYVHMYISTYLLVPVEGTTQLCRTSKLSINAEDEDNYCMNKPEKIRTYIYVCTCQSVNHHLWMTVPAR